MEKSWELQLEELLGFLVEILPQNLESLSFSNFDKILPWNIQETELGTVISRVENGQICPLANLPLTQGNMNGQATFYYTYGITPQRQCYYINNQLHGPSTTWHTNGILATKSQYDNGILNGCFETYDEKGALLLRCNYLNGKLDGPYEIYAGGKLQQTQNYKEGQLTIS